MNFAKFTEREFRLAVAVLLFIAPAGNLVLSFSDSMLSNWYHLDVLIPFLKSVPPYEWAWLALLSLGGIGLMFPYRWSLNFALFCVSLVSFLGAYRWLFGAGEGMASGKSFAVFGLGGSVLALFAVSSFRFDSVARFLPGRLRRKSG